MHIRYGERALSKIIFFPGSAAGEHLIMDDKVM